MFSLTENDVAASNLGEIGDVGVLDVALFTTGGLMLGLRTRLVGVS
jgi:hypothetical protein